MSILLLVAILCTGSVLSQVQVPCYGEDCANVTVYLGPRWGSRVVMVPRTKTTTRPGVDRNQLEVSTDRVEHEEKHRPQHRPVPPGGEFQVDFMDDESPSNPIQPTRNPYRSNIPWSWRDPLTTRRLSEDRLVTTNHSSMEVHVVVDQYDRGTVDLSWRGYKGEDVKRVLMSLSESNRSRVNKLILDGNRIRHLPVLVFPVEFEYGLQELSLTHNSFSPPFLTSYSRFELSRMARLKTLNMTRCGLKSIEMPNLPSLEVLDLSYNELFSLSPSLGRLRNLLQLFLRGNRITYISDSPLSSLTNLWVLDLGYNGLREIQGEPLENLRSLVTVKLDNNRLSSLPLLDSDRTKIVSLANNSLQCSCPLMRWMGWQNGQFQYDYFESCQDGDRTIPLYELRAGNEIYHHFCDDRWWVAHAWAAVALWCRRNTDIMRVIYKVVGVSIVVVVLLVLLKRRKKLTGKTKPCGIPYSILDEQQVSTVSGPRVDV